MKFSLSHRRGEGKTRTERAGIFYDVYIAQQRWNDHTASSCACTPGNPVCKKGKAIRREYLKLRARCEQLLDQDTWTAPTSRNPQQRRER